MSAEVRIGSAGGDITQPDTADAALRVTQPAVRVMRLAPRGMISFQVYPVVRAGIAALRRALDFDAPSEPNTATSRGETSCLWIEPHQWLIDCDSSHAQSLAASLFASERSIAGVARAIVRSDSLDSLLMEGAAATALLAKGCPLDLSCRAKRPGAALRTRFADIPLIVHKLAPSTFRLHVDASLSHQLWLWIEDACEEFAAVETPR